MTAPTTTEAGNATLASRTFCSVTQFMGSEMQKPPRLHVSGREARKPAQLHIGTITCAHALGCLTSRRPALWHGDAAHKLPGMTHLEHGEASCVVQRGHAPE